MSTIDIHTRKVPGLGGFNATLLSIELKRVLRNRRTVIFTLVLPLVLLLTIGNQRNWSESIGRGNLAAYLMVSMGLYGAALTAASGGAAVATERAVGWSRQLRLTPLNPVAYILTKALIALVMGGIVLTMVNIVGKVQGHAHMSAGIWIACIFTSLFCTLTFAALGVFVGYLVPSENVMQILGPGLAVLSLLGGIFTPLTNFPQAVRVVAYFDPMFGVGTVARAPLTHDLPWYAVVNAIVWLALFVAGAAWRMSKDTARV